MKIAGILLAILNIFVIPFLVMTNQGGLAIMSASAVIVVIIVLALNWKDWK